MAYNEDTRVKIPALLHLESIGYTYLSLKGLSFDDRTNILTAIFKESIAKINSNIENINYDLLLSDIAETLDNDDLGRSFYNRLFSSTGTKLIDFDDFQNNTFNVVTEMTCKRDEEEFRPDITVFANGIPLVFIEVKKPNNREGILAERKRINLRFENRKFRRFINETQFMIFSNNMEYDTESIVPIQGAFYASIAKKETMFNCFREEDDNIFKIGQTVSPEREEFILKDNNLVSIKHSEEYKTNCSEMKSTKKIISSLLSKNRLKMIFQYGLTYVKEDSGLQKHIMRYPQLFATYAIEKTINQGIKKGIIWHTQGSGKTALAYFNVSFLKDYFQKKNTIAKFYFIVDRIDLMTQARDEFVARGLEVNIVTSKEEFIKNIKTIGAISNNTGNNEINVVNIQKFSEDSKVTDAKDYDINVQRIYFLDEAHRSYNPEGSFLANLVSSDRNAIIIGLTGTPLLNRKIQIGDKKVKYFSKDVFGDYIHKYFYNLSIEDGYTLKLIREGIETKYKAQFKDILKQIETEKGSVAKRIVYSHPKYVESLANYVAQDFAKSKIRYGDDTIGAMVVCESGDQAKQFYKEIEENHKEVKSALILCDVDDKEIRKNNRNDFKAGKIDLLIVYNMLLTGFDAKRLKKLYLNRVVKDHNLLQTLTRVNRAYKNFRYGYVVDFADIRYEFDKTNREYFAELQEELGEELENYNKLFKSSEEIEHEIAEIKEKLFIYNINNAEIFCDQITEINDHKEVLDLKKVLENAKSLANIIKLYDHSELWDKLDFHKLNTLLLQVNDRLALISQKDKLENDIDGTNLINLALEDIVFDFIKVSEKELELGICDEFKSQLAKTREAMQNNFDHKDIVYTSLYEELERIFKKKKFSEMNTEDLESSVSLLRSIYDKITEQNRRDNMLKAKYEYDEKFARIHKRLKEMDPSEYGKRELAINEALLAIKHQTDNKIYLKNDLINNEAFFESDIMPVMISAFKNAGLKLDILSAKQIDRLIVTEYLNEYRGWIA